MPAFLQSFIEAEQERSRRIEQLRKEIREFAKEEAGSSITEQILLFLADEMVEHLSEIDYELRMKFELRSTNTADKAKLHLPIYRNVRPDTAGVHPGTDENSGWTEGM